MIVLLDDSSEDTTRLKVREVIRLDRHGQIRLDSHGQIRQSRPEDSHGQILVMAISRHR